MSEHTYYTYRTVKLQVSKRVLLAVALVAAALVAAAYVMQAPANCGLRYIPIVPCTTDSDCEERNPHIDPASQMRH